MSENPQDSNPTPNCIEKCLICKNNTQYTRNQSIHTREFYIKGLGQTCGSCYYGMHNVSTTYNIDIDDIYDHFANNDY